MISNDGVKLPQMTWPKVAAICATAIGSAGLAVIGIGHFWLDSMDRNIGQLHDEFAQVMQQNGALQGALGGTRSDLIKDISETREIVAANSAKLDDVKSQLGDLQTQVNEVRDMLLKKQ